MKHPPLSAASYDNYSRLQKERLDAPFFLSGRPANAKVSVVASGQVCLLRRVQKTSSTIDQSLMLLHASLLLTGSL